jgi:hypothetical protein
VFYEIVSTQTITTAGQVEEIVWKEPVVYVTEEAFTTVTIRGPAPQKVKVRHDHLGRHRNHGRREH